MRQIILILLIIFPLSAFAGEKREYSTSLFSFVMPEGMKLDETESNTVSLVFDNDVNLELGSISVSAKKNDKNPWDKIRPLLISGKIVKKEEEVDLSDMRWRHMMLTDASGPCEISDVVYYSFTNGVVYSIHYHCAVNKCDSIVKAFNEITESFKRK